MTIISEILPMNCCEDCYDPRTASSRWDVHYGRTPLNVQVIIREDRGQALPCDNTMIENCF